MLQTHTGALHAAPQPPRAVMLLEDGLEKVAGAVAELLVHAREIDPRTDEYGHARSRAYGDAVALLKASAKVGHTIAELSGSKFEHNINVRRDEPAPAQEASTPAPTGPGFGFQGRIRLTDGRVCMRAPNNRWRIIEEDCDCHEHNRGGDTPTPISEGSNGNFAPSAGRADASRGQVDATAAAQPDSAAAEFAKTADDDSDEGDSCLRYQGCEIDPNVGLPDGQRYVYGKGWMHVPDDWDEEAWRRTQNEGGERGTPTPISGGSNGNFADDTRARPLIAEPADGTRS